MRDYAGFEDPLECTSLQSFRLKKNRYDKIKERSEKWHSKWEDNRFTHRMARLLKVNEKRLSKIIIEPPLNSCRINRLKLVSRRDFLEQTKAEGFNLTPLDWYPDAFTFSSPKKEFAESRFVKEGIAFIQNASSFLPSLALQPQEGDEIFDACAAPGAKSSHIAGLANGNLYLWLNDGIKERLKKLEDVKTVLGLKSNETTSFLVQFADREINRTFDKILLDVQCSGEGMMDVNKPYSLSNWTMDRVIKYMHLQTKALRACFRLLKPGGRLVYSTCTYSPEENEWPISTLLRDFNDAVIQPLVFSEPYVHRAEKNWGAQRFPPDLSVGALRVLPHDAMEGFFVCCIRKLGNGLQKSDCLPIDLMEEGRKRAQEAEDRAVRLLNGIADNG